MIHVLQVVAGDEAKVVGAHRLNRLLAGHRLIRSFGYSGLVLHKGGVLGKGYSGCTGEGEGEGGLRSQALDPNRLLCP